MTAAHPVSWTYKQGSSKQYVESSIQQGKTSVSVNYDLAEYAAIQYRPYETSTHYVPFLFD